MLINRALRAFLWGELGKHRRSGIQFVHKHRMNCRANG